MKSLPIFALLLAAPLAAKGATLPPPTQTEQHQIQDLPALQSVQQDVVVLADELTLSQALALVLLHNPELTAFSWEIRVKEAEAIQSGLISNPELVMERENFAGSGAFSGSRLSEDTIAISQLIRLGGKRQKGRSASTLMAELAGWDYESKRLDILMATTRSFVAVLAAQIGVDQARELEQLTQRFFQTVVERVEAGESSPVEQTRAQVTLSTAHIAREQARFELEAARKTLAALWGQETMIFESVVGDLEQVEPIPTLDQLQSYLRGNPDIARWEAEERLRDVRLRLEKANAIPDLTVSAGVRKFGESDERAYVLGISIPLSISDRNQGNIAAARAAKSQVGFEIEATRLSAYSNLANRYRELRAAYLAVVTLQQEIIPSAEKAFAAIDLGYVAGKFSFLEVLDVQRTLFEVKSQYIDVLAAYHKARADVERLIGVSILTIPESPKEEN